MYIAYGLSELILEPWGIPHNRVLLMDGRIFNRVRLFDEV